MLDVRNNGNVVNWFWGCREKEKERDGKQLAGAWKIYRVDGCM